VVGHDPTRGVSIYNKFIKSNLKKLSGQPIIINLSLCHHTELLLYCMILTIETEWHVCISTHWNIFSSFQNIHPNLLLESFIFPPRQTQNLGGVAISYKTKNPEFLSLGLFVFLFYISFRRLYFLKH